MELVFYIFSITTMLATLRVITNNQIMQALLYLIVSILTIACIFFIMGAYFAGALEIIIYAGAIMVLFVFVVMMFDIDAINKKEHLYLKISIYIGSIIILLILYSFLEKDIHKISGESINIKNIGTALFGPYILAVELSSILLLSGLIVAFHIGHNESYHQIANKEILINNKKD